MLMICLPPLGCVCVLKIYMCVQESRENYFVALKKKARVEKAEIERMPWTKEEEEVEMMESDAEGFELEDIDEEVDSSGYPDRYGS